MIRPISLCLRAWKLYFLRRLPSQRDFRQSLINGLPSPYSGEYWNIADPKTLSSWDPSQALKYKDLFFKGLLFSNIPKVKEFFDFMYWYHYPISINVKKPKNPPLQLLYYSVINFDFFYLDRMRYPEALHYFYNSFNEEEISSIIELGKDLPRRNFNEFLEKGKVHYES